MEAGLVRQPITYQGEYVVVGTSLEATKEAIAIVQRQARATIAVHFGLSADEQEERIKSLLLENKWRISVKPKRGKDGTLTILVKVTITE